MANINQVITLGIGTPASIPYFLTFGLGIGQEVAAAADIIVRAHADVETIRARADVDTVRAK